MTDTVPPRELLQYATQIVSAHAASNHARTQDIPALINSVYQALVACVDGSAGFDTKTLVPAVPIKRSVFPDYIVCLEDGKKLKMLKRHLNTSYNMTPHQYRERWGLGPDYPMVAPNYARHRSSLAKKIGLGRIERPLQTREFVEAVEIVGPTDDASKGRGKVGRPKKAAEANDVPAG